MGQNYSETGEKRTKYKVSHQKTFKKWTNINPWPSNHYGAYTVMLCSSLWIHQLKESISYLTSWLCITFFVNTYICRAPFYETKTGLIWQLLKYIWHELGGSQSKNGIVHSILFTNCLSLSLFWWTVGLKFPTKP